MAAERIRKANTELARSRKELHEKNLELEDDLRWRAKSRSRCCRSNTPASRASLRRRKSAFHFTHRYLPTGTVGGDFFTVSALSDDEASVFIAMWRGTACAPRW